MFLCFVFNMSFETAYKLKMVEGGVGLKETHKEFTTERNKLTLCLT